MRTRWPGCTAGLRWWPCAQAQVDGGEESGVLIGTPKACSFHMVLSYSRDPFCCYTARTDLATFFACHIRAFDYFGGVPGSVVYDRTKTVVKRHVAPGLAVPVHPEAAAFAAITASISTSWLLTGRPGNLGLHTAPLRSMRVLCCCL